MVFRDWRLTVKARPMVGKWHLGHSDAYWPTEHGFDTFFGVAYSNDMQPFDLYEQKTIIEAPADQKALKRRVLKWKQRAASSPCFDALPNGEPVPTSPGSAIAGRYADAAVAKMRDAVAGFAKEPINPFAPDDPDTPIGPHLSQN